MTAVGAEGYTFVDNVIVATTVSNTTPSRNSGSTTVLIIAHHSLLFWTGHVPAKEWKMKMNGKRPCVGWCAIQRRHVSGENEQEQPVHCNNNNNSTYILTTSRLRSACLCNLALLTCERLASLLRVRNVPGPNTDTHYPEVLVLVTFLLTSFRDGTAPSDTTLPIQLPLIMTPGLTV
jgi:hypothetical protein